MARFRPIHGLFLVALFMATVLVASYALDGGLTRHGYTRVRPGPNGEVQLAVGDLKSDQIRFYEYLNPANQVVKFFVARDRQGDLQVAFDASEVCYKLRRGFRLDGNWVVCNKCDKAFHLAEINAGGGGCKPVPLRFQQQGDKLLLSEADLLTGWRLFR